MSKANTAAKLIEGTVGQEGLCKKLLDLAGIFNPLFDQFRSNVASNIEDEASRAAPWKRPHLESGPPLNNGPPLKKPSLESGPPLPSHETAYMYISIELCLCMCRCAIKAPYATLNDELKKARSAMLEAKELSSVIIQGLKRAKARAKSGCGRSQPKTKKARTDGEGS